MDSLGGYRLVRRLGAGSRSEVWLASDGEETAAIKVFREDAERGGIDTEIEALGRASGRHLVRLDDLAMGPDGRPCLILQRLSQWNLGRVLASTRPSNGEAVTILAPLCLAVAELHRVGVAHGRVHGASVRFDRSGAPVLASFGAATLFGPIPDREEMSSLPPAKLMKQAEVAQDLDGLTGLCRSTLRGDSEVIRWLAQTDSRDDSTFARELADRLFRFAEPMPVRFFPSAREESTALIPSRTAEPAESYAGMIASDAAALLHVPEGMRKSLTEWFTKNVETSPVAAVTRRIKDALRPVRKPVWIVAALVAVSVIAATALMPASGNADASNADASNSEGSQSGGSHSGAVLPALETGPGPGEINGEVSAAITGDDPLAAASVLLDTRTACFEDRSVLCLDSVNQHGSAAMQADATQIRLLQQGGAATGSGFTESRGNDVPSATRHIDIQERLGDTVLLSVTFGEPEGTQEGAQESFSLLLIKRDEGWRIRDLTPVTNSPY